MTEKIWSFVNDRQLKRDSKVKLFLLIRSLIYIALGLLVWLVLSATVSLTAEWGLCIVLFMTILGYVGGIFYLYKKY